jgi:16S rRNA (guanine966-N2)-methyltransferase
MRIVGGEFRGRALVAPAGSETRPTSDRVREALFNILAHGDYPLKGARVIDLFAGAGALGLEALSRGASFALFVEEAAPARAAINRNIEALGLTGRTRTFRRDATDLGKIQAGLKPFDLAFLDPPYARCLLSPALEALARGGWLAPGARLIAEMREGEAFTPPAAFVVTGERTYGETTIRFLALASRAPTTTSSG